MKLFSAAVALSLTLSTIVACGPAFAGVKEDVAALGQLANGYDVESVKGKTHEEIFKKFIEKNNGDVEELVYKEYKEMDWSDEVNEGFTSVESAIDMGGFAEGVIEEAMEGAEGAELAKLKKELAALQKGWAPLIQKLSRQGVKFGYTGWGPGYCGVSFIEMIIVDAKEQKVYQVYLSQGGQC